MISFELDDRAVVAALAQLRYHARDLSTAFREIGSSLVDEIKLGFTDSKDPWGAPWAPLSERTQAMNKGRRRDGQPLLDTGKLRNSMTYRADKDSVEVGTSDFEKKALTHQFGSKNAWGRKIKVPARPFLPIIGKAVDLPDHWEAELLDVLRSHLAGK